MNRPPMVRDCLNCKRDVTLSWDEKRGYCRGDCQCGASCTSDHRVALITEVCPAHPTTGGTHESLAGEMRCAYCGKRLAPYPCHACGKFLTARRMHEAASGEMPHHCEECL